MMRRKIKLVSKLNFYGSLNAEQTKQSTENCGLSQESIPKLILSFTRESRKVKVKFSSIFI